MPELKEINELRIEHITKRFPGVLACDDISLTIGKHEVLALVGENGAGKTTLMNIVMGLYQSDEGAIYINGEKVSFKSPNDAFACGIGMVHQQYMLVPNMTVLENIALGMKSTWGFTVDLKSVREKITDVSTHYGLSVDPDAFVWQLSVGEQQRVELVKTLCLGAKFLILDEPTSAVDVQSEAIIFKNIISNQKGKTTLIISHRFSTVRKAKNIIVLDKGKVIESGTHEELIANNGMYKEMFEVQAEGYN